MSNQTAVLVNPEKQDTEEEEARELISVLLIVTCPIFLLYSQYLLHKYKNERTIKKRSLFYIRLATVAGWLAELNLVISTLNIQAPCFIFYCVQLLIAPLAIGPQLLRSIRLWSMYKLSFLVLRQEVIRKDQSSRRMSSMKRAGTGIRISGSLYQRTYARQTLRRDIPSPNRVACSLLQMFQPNPLLPPPMRFLALFSPSSWHRTKSS